MIRTMTLAALAAFSLAGAAFADTPPASTSQPAANATPPGPDPNARRCVSETPTGARVPRRTCRTNAEWAAMAQAARNRQTGDHTSCHADREDCTAVGNPQSGGNSGGG